MRAAAILGLGSSLEQLEPFRQAGGAQWAMGLPARGEADAVLVLGGDGTVHRHLGALVDLRAPVLVVPCGSGNDFARALGIASRQDALRAWKQFLAGQGNVRAVDLGRITAAGEPGGGRYFSCAGGVGIDGEIAQRANRMPRWLRGHGGYALALPGALAGYRAAVMTVELERQPGEWVKQPSRRLLAAVFANAPVYGGGMRVAPGARLDDGLLDACLIDELSFLRVLWLFPRVYAGRHVGLKPVVYEQALRARISSDPALAVYADGELVCRTPAEFAIAPGALRVVV